MEQLERSATRAGNDAAQGDGVVAISLDRTLREFRQVPAPEIPGGPAEKLGGLNSSRIFEIVSRHRSLEVDEVKLTADADDVAAVWIGVEESSFPQLDGPALATAVVGEDAVEQFPFPVDPNSGILKQVLQRGTVQVLDDEIIRASKLRNLQRGQDGDFDAGIQPQTEGDLFAGESFARIVAGVALDDVGLAALLKEGGVVGGNPGSLERL